MQSRAFSEAYSKIILLITIFNIIKTQCKFHDTSIFSNACISLVFNYTMEKKLSSLSHKDRIAIKSQKPSSESPLSDCSFQKWKMITSMNAIPSLPAQTQSWCKRVQAACLAHTPHWVSTAQNWSVQNNTSQQLFEYIHSMHSMYFILSSWAISTTYRDTVSLKKPS